MPLFKRIYNRGPKNEIDLTLGISHIDVLRSTPRWRPSPRVIEKGMAEGWLSVFDGDFTIKTGPDADDVVYHIERRPGHYCCECHELLDGEHAARRHVLEEHCGLPAKKIPKDSQELQGVFHSLLADTKYEPSEAAHPSGYCRNNFFDCVRV